SLEDECLTVYQVAFKESAEVFQPDVIINQNGADAHFYDPLTLLCASMKIFEKIPLLAHKLAHKFGHGKWIALGGGGYDFWRAVPRSWAQIWNIMKDGKPQQGSLPSSWLQKWQKKSSVYLSIYCNDLIQHIPQ